MSNVNAQLPLSAIYQRIADKRNIYEDIASKSHAVEIEKAKRIVNSELETYLTRLNEYWQDPNTHKKGAPTLTEAQGVNIFLEVLQSGLSFSKTANHIYLSRLKGTGTAIGYQLTADGMIYKAQKAGAIDHLSEPVLVQQGEKFAIKTTPEGKHIAEHTILFDGRPKFNFDNMLLGYVYIVYPNGDRELSWINRNRLDEYRSKSLNRNLYNDESFIQTKVIKHALRKVRKTDFMMEIEAEDEDVISENREFEPASIPNITPPTTTVDPNVSFQEPKISNEPF